MSSDRESQKHKNDIYGDLERETQTPAIPAATVVLLADRPSGAEVLMLRKNSKIAFGGMWVFPGGRIDEADYPEDGDLETAARAAAARETHEEASIAVERDDFVWFAHWTPPPSTARRYATWFFMTQVAGGEAIVVDGGEILDHRWITPREALEKHRAGEIDLAPPTWVSLYHLSRQASVATALAHFRDSEPRVYETRPARRADGVRVAMWRGDAGYDDQDPDIEGGRHRLVMDRDGFVFEHSAVDY